jgi:hypothetical protein
LLKVTICGQRIRESPFAHQQHRPTIRQAVTLIRTGLVRSEASAERPPVLRHNGDPRVAEDGLNRPDRCRPDVRALVGYALECSVRTASAVKCGVQPPDCRRHEA